MNLTNISRFTLDKDAAIFLRKNKVYSSELKTGIAKQKDFKLIYKGDKDFGKFMYGNFGKINELAKYYKDLDLFLKNINWDTFYKDIDKTATGILKKISEKSDKSVNLSIINMTPLEMAIIGKIFEDYGIKNIVYNLNRQPAVNSATKTLEAFLYLVAYNKSSYFKERNTKIVEKLKLNKFNTNLEKQYIIFDENNSIDSYNYHNIDEYVKNQIGYKVPKNVYRLDKYPDKDFLLNKGIKEIYFFDNDSDLGKISDYYKGYLKDEETGISLKKIKYTLKNKYHNIGFFEDYLIDENRDYLNYKKKIDKKAKQTSRTYSSKTSYNTYSASAYNKNKSSSMAENDKKKLLPFLFLYPILVIAFLVTDLGGVSSSSTGGGSGYSSTYIGGGSYGTRSSSTSSTKSSSSIIKSFGGGGFSKGTS